MPRIFISQALVDEWMGAGQLTLEGDLVRINASASPVTLSINPAVYFERIDGSDTDPYDVVGAVKTAEELGQMGAEHYDTSVVLGDYAYTVKPGFLSVMVGTDGSEALMDGTTWGQLLTVFQQIAPQHS